MARKDLSKTVIEGGRSNHCKIERHFLLRKERTATRDYCKKLLVNPELSDEEEIGSIGRIRKEFDDKISPLNRWLESKLGQPWDEVRSEACKMFDIRTTPGRHIIQDHLVGMIERNTAYFERNYDVSNFYRSFFYVKDGFLAKTPGYTKTVRVKFSMQDGNKVIDWLDGRVVGKVGNKMYWFITDDKIKISFRGNFTYSNIGISESVALLRTFYNSGNIINFRQHKELSKEDVEIWYSIPKFHQDKLLEYSPV